MLTPLASAAGVIDSTASVGQRAERHELRRQLQRAAHDARHVEQVVDDLHLRRRVAVNRVERARNLSRLHVPVAQHRRPAENRVQRRSQLVRERRQELVLEPVGRLGVFARIGQRSKQIAKLVLPLTAAHRAADEAERRTEPDRPLEQHDVAQPFEQAERPQIDFRSLGIGEEQNRNIGPRRLRAKALHQLADFRVFERFFGEHDDGRTAAEFDAQRRATVVQTQPRSSVRCSTSSVSERVLADGSEDEDSLVERWVDALDAHARFRRGPSR